LPREAKAVVVAEQREEEEEAKVEVEREEPVPEKALETPGVGPALPENPVAEVAQTIRPPNRSPSSKRRPADFRAQPFIPSRTKEATGSK